MIVEHTSRNLLVGGGITAFAVARVFDQLSIPYDWIAPALTMSQLADCARRGTGREKEAVSFSYSPKLSRNDYLIDQCLSAQLLGQIKATNFLLSRSTRLGGLANYWGANTARSCTYSLDEPGLCQQDIELLHKLIPTISIHENPRLDASSLKAVGRFLGRLQRACDVEATDGTVYPAEIALNAFPRIGEDLISFNPTVVGNWSDTSPSVLPLQQGVVTGVERMDDGFLVQVQPGEDLSPTRRNYQSLILCAGPVENLRLLAGLDTCLQGQAFALQHHPIVTGFMWSYSVPSPVRSWPLSGFDVYIRSFLPQTLAHECYVNIIPAYSTLTSALREHPFAYWLICSPLGRWLLSRLFVVNAYLPSSLTASYIRAVQGGEIPISLEVFGNYHPVIHALLPAMKRRLRSIFRRSGMWFFLMRLLPPGTDQHLSSSLAGCCDGDALYWGHSSDQPILVPDASTAPKMPIHNPTYSFVLRAMRLVRSASKNGLIAS
jgi:hypothetical protein